MLSLSYKALLYSQVRTPRGNEKLILSDSLFFRTVWWILATCRPCYRGTWRPRCPSTWTISWYRSAQTWTTAYQWSTSVLTWGNTWSGLSAVAVVPWSRRQSRPRCLLTASSTTSPANPPQACCKWVQIYSAACWIEIWCKYIFAGLERTNGLLMKN